MVNGERGVWQQLADRAGVAGMRVDHHHLHGVTELRTAQGQPAADRGSGTPIVPNSRHPQVSTLYTWLPSYLNRTYGFVSTGQRPSPPW